MRVVQASCYVDPAGRTADVLLDAWPILHDVARATQQAGIELTVVHAARADESVERDGVRYDFVRERAPSSLQRRLGYWSWPLTPRVVERVRSLRPDVIHVHGLSFPRHAQRLAAVAPVLVQDRADRVPPLLQRAAWRRGFAAVAGVMFAARAQARPFIDAGLLPRATRVFEVLGVSSTFTPDDVGRARAASGVHGDPCFVWVGHLDARKDPITLVDALARATPSLADPQLWCCFGTAPLLDAVRARTGTYPQLSGRVHFLGTRPREEVELLLRAADFLVSGSRHEGTGLAVIEAYACGATPIVSDIPSFRRITADGAAGGLAPCGDVAAFARVIAEWSKRDRTELRRAARSHFERNLSFQAMGRELGDAYRAVARPR
jgi:glycosyltransferase involved in cell wall biosynthesis